MENNTDNQNEQPKIAASRCWFWPLSGVLFTFLAGFPFNYLIKDYRELWDLISSVLNALFIFLGLYFISRNFIFYKSCRRTNLLLHTTAGVLLNAGLAMLLFINGLANYYFNADAHTAFVQHVQQADKGLLHKPYQGLYPNKLDVWLDVIPNGKHGELEDMDTYWTLVTALRSPELNILGISTVFGQRNEVPQGPSGSEPVLFKEIATNLEIAAVAAANSLTTDKKKPVKKDEIAQQITPASHFLAVPPLYIGSMGPGTPYWPVTAASTALANCLFQQRLTIIALGPLTNIATVLKHHPDLASHIERIILLAGRQPDDILYAGKQWWHQFRPLNAALDTVAANVVLYSGVPLVLVPFELATRLPITAGDLQSLNQGDLAAQWLCHKSQPWLGYWQITLGKEGFHAFNWLTIGYATLPELFSSRPMSARIGFNLFLEPFGMGRNIEIIANPKGPQVIYCYNLDITLKEKLINRLKGPLPVAPGSVPVKK